MTETTGKGSVQFPLDKPMPLSLITKIVKYRVKGNMQQTVEHGQEEPKLVTAYPAK